MKFRQVVDFLGRAIMCFILPPLAVLDKGYGAIVLVTLLTFAGWAPGAVAALIISLFDKR